MKSYFGQFTERPGDEPQEATVLVFEKNLSIGYRLADQSTRTLRWNLHEVDLSGYSGTGDSVLRNRVVGRGELRIPGTEAAAWIRECQAEAQKPWYRRSMAREWLRNSSLLLLMAFLLAALYFLLVPWLSEKLASRVPRETETALGDAVYDAMGLKAKEDTRQSHLLNAFFAEMKVPASYPVRIAVVDDPVMNAFALPGGRIVVYKPLLEKISHAPELAALLSHEFIHVERRHATRSIFRQLGSKVFLGLLFGRFGTVSSVLVSRADDLKSLTYSRAREKEADIEGLRILQERRLDPEGFTRLFRHLREAAPEAGLPEFMASHPDIEKRIRYIRDASGSSAVRDDPALEHIFQQIKKTK